MEAPFLLSFCSFSYASVKLISFIQIKQAVDSLNGHKPVNPGIYNLLAAISLRIAWDLRY